MPRYIDAVSKAEVLETYAELYDVFEDNREIKKELHKVYDKLNALQTADVVEVVRCKDCRHYDLQDLSNTKHNTDWCVLNGFNPQSNDYCSYGERKEDV